MNRIHESYNPLVGARSLFLRPQFNGKQEGAFNRLPNLRCPRNGKRTNHLFDRFCFHQDHWLHAKHAAGKVMEVVPPARIPANKVVVSFIVMDGAQP